jgi:hypothetical protein
MRLLKPGDRMAAARSQTFHQDATPLLRRDNYGEISSGANMYDAAGLRSRISHPASPHHEEPPQGGVSNGDFAQDEDEFGVPLTVYLILSEVEGRTAPVQMCACPSAFAGTTKMKSPPKPIALECALPHAPNIFFRFSNPA